MAKRCARSCAALTLSLVIHEHREYHGILVDGETLNERDRKLAASLVYQSLRLWPRLHLQMQILHPKGWKRKQHILQALFAVGLCQLQLPFIQQHAAVYETIQAATALGFSFAKGFLNALLRKAIQTDFLAQLKGKDLLVYQYNHPLWMIEALQKQWPHHHSALMQAGDQQSPMDLCVHTKYHTVPAYLERLKQQGIEAKALESLCAIRLTSPVPVEQLPGFAQGHCSVQDVHAQQTIELFDWPQHGRALDACSAPGGKLVHAFDISPNLQWTALEPQPQRYRQLQETLSRTGLSVTTHQRGADESLEDLGLFDVILCDTPCSATGVISRHPDIKVLRDKEALLRITQLQKRILEQLMPILAPGGCLIYMTCSLLEEENDQAIKALLALDPSLQCRPPLCIPSSAIRTDYGVQFLPGAHDDGGNGLYAACLQKC